MANYGTVTSAQQTASSESESASSSNTSAHSTQQGSSLSSSLQSSSSVTSFNALTNALRPDPGTEADFIVDDNPFAFSPGLLNKLLAPKSISALLAFGGSEGLQKGLQTDLVAGLSVDETSVPTTVTLEEATGALLTSTRSERPLSNKAFDDRIRVFNTNILPKRRGARRWTLIRSSVSWGMLPLLSFACVSFSLTIYTQRKISEPPQVPSTNTTDGSHHDIPQGAETNATEAEWTNGVAIGVVILLTTIVSIYNKLGAESILCKTHALSDARTTRVVRSGKTLTINSNDLLVGDVMILQAGNVVPADGVFIRGHGVVCDESDTTGESGPLEKMDADAVASTCRRGGSLRNRDPFMVSGAKVLQGVGKVLVTSVGVNSNWGKITMALRSSQEEPSSLEKRLEDIRRNMARLGCAIALLVLLVLIIRYTVDFRAMPRPWLEALSQITNIYITVTTIVFIAVCPGALSFVVPFLRAHSTPRLLKQNALLRAPSGHETVSSVTTILCDTKDLVEKEASVMSGTLDGAAFDTRAATSAEYQSVSQWVAALGPWATQVFIESAVINSTTYGGEDELNDVHVRDAVEEALLTFVSDHLSLASVSEARQSNEIVEVLPYDSNSQIMATVVKHHARSGYRLLLKGTPGVLLNFCTLKADSSLLTASDLTRTDRTKFKGVVDSDSSQGLSSIGFAYCDIRQWPPASSSTACRTLDLLQRDEIQLNLVFLGILSVQHNLRRNTPETVRRFQLAGISVRLVTGDDILTAKTIATESFIHVEGGIILDGSTFRSLEDEALMDILPRLQVLAQASPSDRKRLVLKLEQLEEVVAVTGDRPEDMEVLRAADVGFSSGIRGSASSKEASSIVLEDCTLPSILKTFLWGRSFDDSVQKVVQYRLPTQISLILLVSVTAMLDRDLSPVLSPVQVLWLQLVADAMAVFALASDPPTEECLDRPPRRRTPLLLTLPLLKVIFGQMIFQLATTLTLYYVGEDMLGLDRDDPEPMHKLKTMVFHLLFATQLFNVINNRQLRNRINVFQGLLGNYFLITILYIVISAQIVIIYAGHRLFSLSPQKLGGTQWALCIGVASTSIPFASILRLIPNRWISSIATPIIIPALAFNRLLWWIRLSIWRPKGQPSEGGIGEEGKDDERSQT